MKEILFRGQRIDNGEWVHGTPFFVQEENFVSIITNCQTLNFKDSETTYTGYSVKPETVSQFTGLKDKNGNKIFEGDIIKQRYFPIGANEKAVEYYREGVIDYQNNCFGIIWKIDGLNILNKDLASYYHKEKKEIYKHPSQGVNWFEKTINNIRVEIIGNIHEEK